MNDSGMVRTVHQDSSVLVLALSGQINMRVSPNLLGQMEPMVREGPERLVIDLSEVLFMDSSGVGALVHLFRLMKNRKGSFALAGPNERVRGLFKITRLDTLFAIHDTLDEAIKP